VLRTLLRPTFLVADTLRLQDSQLYWERSDGEFNGELNGELTWRIEKEDYQRLNGELIGQSMVNPGELTLNPGELTAN
jgi:hypothetical protein